jgi:hypothetical protein
MSLSTAAREEIAELWGLANYAIDRGSYDYDQWLAQLRREVFLLGDENGLEAIVQLGIDRDYIATADDVDALLSPASSSKVAKDFNPDQERGDDGKWTAGGGSGGGAESARAHMGSFASQHGKDHDTVAHVVNWAGIKARETGKTTYVFPKAGLTTAAYKAPGRGTYLAVHPDGKVEHVDPAAAKAPKLTTEQVRAKIDAARASTADKPSTALPPAKGKEDIQAPRKVEPPPDDHHAGHDKERAAVVPSATTTEPTSPKLEQLREKLAVAQQRTAEARAALAAAQARTAAGPLDARLRAATDRAAAARATLGGSGHDTYAPPNAQAARDAVAALNHRPAQPEGGSMRERLDRARLAAEQSRQQAANQPPPPPPKLVAATQPVSIGVHIKTLDAPSPAGQAAAKRIGSAIEAHPTVHALLEQHPLDKLQIGAGVRAGAAGMFRQTAKGGAKEHAISLPVHSREGVGQQLNPGTTWSMSNTARDAEHAQQITFLHEVGHHLEASVPGVKGDIQAAADNRRLAGGRPPSFITDYAKKDRSEWFAETFAAYHVAPDALKAHDPVGHALVETALRRAGVYQ